MSKDDRCVRCGKEPAPYLGFITFAAPIGKKVVCYCEVCASILGDTGRGFLPPERRPAAATK